MVRFDRSARRRVAKRLGREQKGKTRGVARRKKRNPREYDRTRFGHHATPDEEFTTFSKSA